MDQLHARFRFAFTMACYVAVTETAALQVCTYPMGSYRWWLAVIGSGAGAVLAKLSPSTIEATQAGMHPQQVGK